MTWLADILLTCGLAALTIGIRLYIEHKPKIDSMLTHAQHIWELEQELGWQPRDAFGFDPPPDKPKPNPIRYTQQGRPFTLNIEKGQRVYPKSNGCSVVMMTTTDFPGYPGNNPQAVVDNLTTRV